MRRIGWWPSGVLILAVAPLLAGCSGNSAARGTPAAPISSPAPVSTATSSTRPAPTLTPTKSRTSSGAHPVPAKTSAAPKLARAGTPPAAKSRPMSLPLHFRTGAASQVITVTAASTSSTEGTLQAWRRSGNGWRRVGSAVPAWLGSDGLTKEPSETRSATPIGSFTLTRAFGRNAGPGTALPYTRTTPADWWISESGPLYNTIQRCASGCAFTQGDPNEHLYYATPFYRYAVVIDYNTRNAPGGVVQGAGSAFFLHVTVGAPTQGCISIDEGRLIRLMRWLSPGRHPRILIGTP